MNMDHMRYVNCCHQLEGRFLSRDDHSDELVGCIFIFIKPLHSTIGSAKSASMLRTQESHFACNSPIAMQPIHPFAQMYKFHANSPRHRAYSTNTQCNATIIKVGRNKKKMGVSPRRLARLIPSCALSFLPSIL
jgi:hypothetical protein